MAKIRCRIGVDVGGTFTHAVALQPESLLILGKAKVPTTHYATEGVALGIAQALAELLKEAHIQSEDVGFIAHSTTQGTNALLEGDVTSTGIIAIGHGLEGWRVRRQTRLGDISLGGGRALSTAHRYLDNRRFFDDAPQIFDELQQEGIGVLVMAEAFSVDDPTRERKLIELALKQGIPATGTHEISGLYGLRIRTRTAAMNASILPPMMQAAAMTEASVKESGITAPLMVMRSDGGVMSIAEVRRRPLLTILSGPAAGVAAALMFVRISEGVFLEVGGTSTDISLISQGRAQVRSAEVGGHRLFLRTLDVRTIGLGGGSMLRIKRDGSVDVGPRSAHIAGLPYACFTPPEKLRDAKAKLISPRPGDPAEYMVLETMDGERFAVTLTCAANAAGVLKDGDYAQGNLHSAKLAFDAVFAAFEKKRSSNVPPAKEMLDAAAAKAEAVVEKLIQENGTSRELTTLVGGGGGAGVLLPVLGKRMKLPSEICPEAEVVSAIGVALALIRETVERNIPNPSKEDLLRIRKEAEQGALHSGAAPESIVVEVEVESRQNLVRAVASGAVELRERDIGRRKISEENRLRIAASSMRLSVDQVKLTTSAGNIFAYQVEVEETKAMGLSRSKRRLLSLIDGEGIVRLSLPNAEVNDCFVSTAIETLRKMLDTHTDYGDAGPCLPAIFLVARERINNLSGLASANQVVSIAQAELERLTAEEKVLLVVAFNN